MTTRRKFLQSAAAGIGYAGITFAVPKGALAATVGSVNEATWAIASDPVLLGKVWTARFTNTLPWALDPTNGVLVKALNVPASGVALDPATPANVGFIYHPDAGTVDTYTVKAGQVDWPILAPLGNTAGIPTTRTWGYGNADLEKVFANGSGLPVTYPGRSFVVQRGTAIKVNWLNNLVDVGGAPLSHLVGVDQSISMQTDQTLAIMDPKTNQVTYQGASLLGVPTAMHHHGGDSRAEFDGGPDQWTAPRRVQWGPGFATANGFTYTYDNAQEAAMNWYHDHGEGVTRINAYAGLAGIYVIRDNNEALLANAGAIPSGPYELPLVIQDKCFTANGELAYAGDPLQYPVPVPDPALLPKPTHFPEQFGDIIVVNGVAWPNLDVEPREYRLRLLNGSDSRVYVLKFGWGGNNRRGGFNAFLPVVKIATDLGFLNSPVEMPRGEVVIAPGERMDVVVDFSMVVPTVPGGPRTVVLTNSGATPFPLGAPTVAGTMGAGTVMRFNVNLPLNSRTAALGMPAVAGSRATKLKNNLALRGLDAATPRLAAPRVPANVKVRRILLGEGVDEFGRVMPLLGAVSLAGDAPLPNGYATNPGTLAFSQVPTETPALNSTEVWEFWNSTVDAHPIHMHLVRFRILNRQAFTAPSVNATTMVNGWTGVQLAADAIGTPMTAAQALTVGGLPSKALAAPLDEQGWKDTVLCYPGQVTRVLVNFNRPGKYVYHCHILSHEEHDMMRWYEVV
ncbi:MAG: multicopper oxidase domain-containing protein [Rhodocyclales bacterium]|nr:multicopper oxidase domain-containing protein [Rhodocyclales bacterium]